MIEGIGRMFGPMPAGAFPGEYEEAYKRWCEEIETWFNKHNNVVPYGPQLPLKPLTQGERKMTEGHQPKGEPLGEVEAPPKDTKPMSEQLKEGFEEAGYLKTQKVWLEQELDDYEVEELKDEATLGSCKVLNITQGSIVVVERDPEAAIPERLINSFKGWWRDLMLEWGMDAKLCLLPPGMRFASVVSTTAHPFDIIREHAEAAEARKHPTVICPGCANEYRHPGPSYELIMEGRECLQCGKAEKEPYIVVKKCRACVYQYEKTQENKQAIEDTGFCVKCLGGVEVGDD